MARRRVEPIDEVIQGVESLGGEDAAVGLVLLVLVLPLLLLFAVAHGGGWFWLAML